MLGLTRVWPIWAVAGVLAVMMFAAAIVQRPKSDRRGSGAGRRR